MKQLVNDVIQLLKSKGKEIANLIIQAEDIQKRIDSNKYDATYIQNTLRPQLSTIRISINDMKAEADNCIKQLTEAKKKEYNQMDEIRGEDLTEDAKLFSCGVPLTSKDINVIMSRNQGNMTMLQLASRYAQEHNLEGCHMADYTTHRDELEGCDNVYAIAHIYCQHWIDNDPKCKILNDFFSQKEEQASECCLDLEAIRGAQNEG